MDWSMSNHLIRLIYDLEQISEFIQCKIYRSVIFYWENCGMIDYQLEKIEKRDLIYNYLCTS